MSFFSFTNCVDTQTAVRLALPSTTSPPTPDAGAPPPLPPGTRQRNREIKAPAHYRTHARSKPHSSAKRW